MSEDRFWFLVFPRKTAIVDDRFLGHIFPTGVKPNSLASPLLENFGAHFLVLVFGPLRFGTRSGCHFLGRAWVPLTGFSAAPGFGPWQ